MHNKNPAPLRKGRGLINGIRGSTLFPENAENRLPFSALGSVTGSPVSHYLTIRRSQLMFKGGKKMILG